MSNQWPKIWGRNNEIFSNDLCSVNVLDIRKGGTCSYHVHKAKNNLFYVIFGKLNLHTELGDVIVESGQNFIIYAGTKHSFQALEDTKAIEVMFVKYDPQDIERESIGYLDEKLIRSTSSFSIEDLEKPSLDAIRG